MSNKVQQFVSPLYDHYDGTSYYAAGALRRYTNRATTDGNGRATVYLTDTGLSTGNALFSSVLGIQAVGVYSGSTSTQAPNTYVESVSADLKTLTLRITTGTTLSLLGILSIVFGGSGYTLYVTVEGVKA